MKILMVEDDMHVQLFYKEELEEEGYEVITAATGKDALELFEKENPDIVTLDILMPDINGKILLKKMKEQRPQTPVIICSAYDYRADFAVWTSESDAYIVKSSDSSTLKSKIKEIIKGGKKEKVMSRRK